MEVFGITIMFLSFVIAYQAWQNGKFIRLVVAWRDN